MKNPLSRFAILIVALAFALTPACSKDSGDHDHDHGEHHENDDHDHGEEKGDNHAEDDHKDDQAGHEDHDHDSIEAGPNGGRILHEVEPHVEFFVTDDRKVRITAVNDDGKAVPVTTQTVSLMGGSRANPTKMKFTREGDVLVSDIAFPEGNDFPVVVQLKSVPEDKTAFAKFNLNLAECPTCDNKEYACICDHEH